MGAASVAARAPTPPPPPLGTVRARHLALAALAEAAAIRLTQELVDRLGRAAALVLGPEAPYIFRIRNFYLQEITIKLDRAHTVLKQAKQLICEAMDVVKDQKEFKQARLVADVDPM